jgi:hypothetical protein
MLTYADTVTACFAESLFLMSAFLSHAVSEARLEDAFVALLIPHSPDAPETCVCVCVCVCVCCVRAV